MKNNENGPQRINARNGREKFWHHIPQHLRRFYNKFQNRKLFNGEYKNEELVNELLYTLNNESIYEGYKYLKRQIENHRNCTKGRIIETIQSYIQNTIKEDRDIGISEIIERIRPDLATLPREEKEVTFLLIETIVEKFNTIRKYLDFKNGPYKTPKELLCAMRGITSNELIENITDDIKVIQYGIGLTFFIGDKKSFQIIYTKRLEDSRINSDAFNLNRSAIDELKKTLSVINGQYTDNTQSCEFLAMQHEGQHNRNSYFMPDKGNNPIVRAKDEITAYLQLGVCNKKGIYDLLTEPEGKGGLYQYGLKGKERKNHKKDVKELLKYADDLIQLTECPIIGLKKEIIISILSYTPYKNRKELHTNIIDAISVFLLGKFGTTGKSLKEKKNMLNEIYQNLNYTSGDKKNNNIIEKSILNGFRRTGIANKETAIYNLKKAKSIEEIKRKLNDPKYSHIPRGPNNKGGIEISAMIDEVMKGYLPITFLSPEIREIIENFIEK